MKKMLFASVMVCLLEFACTCRGESGVESKVIPAGNIPMSIRPGLLGDSGVAAGDLATVNDLATKLSISNITQTVTSGTDTVPSNKAVQDALDENLIVIPNALYAVASNQCFVGFDNLISADYKDYWWDTSGAGQQFDWSWQYTPTNNASDFSLMIIRGTRFNNKILSSNQIPVYVGTLEDGASGLGFTNAVTTLSTTPAAVGTVSATITGYGQLRSFTSKFNTVNIPVVVGNTGGTTGAIDRIAVEIRNIIYTAGDNGNVTNVQTGSIVATGSVSVASANTTNLDVSVTLNKTILQSDITGNCLFVGYRAFKSDGLNASVLRVTGTASDIVATNNQSHYFWNNVTNWMDFSGDGNMGIKLALVGVSPTNKILCVGDSTTAGGQWVYRMTSLASNDLMKIVTLGTKTNSAYAGNFHEGISGWTWNAFTSSTSSPFVAAGVLNMSNYFANVISNSPDYVLVHLGINDTYLATDALTDGGILAQWTLDYPRITNFIAQVLAYNPSARVGLAMTIPPAYEQYAFGDDYNVGKTRYRQKRNQLLYAKYIQDSFSTYNTNSVFVIPVYASLDSLYNFSTGDYAPNIHNTNTIVRQSNGVHPATSGYYQMGDVLWAWLKYIVVR
jgi:lysophospholipase L1-like esterase